MSAPKNAGWINVLAIAMALTLLTGCAEAPRKVAEATEEMQKIGRMMWRHPTLDPQVEAYAEVIAGRPCTADPVHCPSSEPDAGLDDGGFPEDACRAP